MIILFTIGEDPNGRLVVPQGVPRSEAITFLPEGAVIKEEIYEDEADNDLLNPPDPLAQLAAWRASATCGPLEIRRALRSTGDYAAIATYMATADELTQEAWNYATVFKRLDPLVLSVQELLGKTDEEVDALFRLAVTLG